MNTFFAKKDIFGSTCWTTMKHEKKINTKQLANSVRNARREEPHGKHFVARTAQKLHISNHFSNKNSIARSMFSRGSVCHFERSIQHNNTTPLSRFCFFWNFTIGPMGSNMFFRISQNYKLLFPSNFSQRQGGHPALF